MIAEGGAACTAVGCEWWTDAADSERAAREHHEATGHTVVAERRVVFGDMLADASLPAILTP